MDIVERFREYCTTLGWKFSHGTIAHLNLIISNSVAGEIYFLMDEPEDDDPANAQGGISNLSYNGTFMLLVKSNFDNVYDNQKGVDPDDGKYRKNIAPLKYIELPRFKKLVDCSDDLERGNFRAKGITNLFDANMDGVFVTFATTYVG